MSDNLLRLFFRMDTYQTQLRTLSNIIDSLLPIENQIEQKLSMLEYSNHYQVSNHSTELFIIGLC